MIFKGIFENKAVSKIFREVEYRFSLVLIARSTKRMLWIYLLTAVRSS